jgi:peroxiredoxin
LRAYQKLIPTIKELGAQLVAISPQLPDHSQAALLKNFLEYEVLSDVGNRVAREYRLVYQVAEPVQAVYRNFGIDLADHNGDASWELPMPGTFVVDRERIVRLAFVDADYTRRLEPAAIIACLRTMTGVGHNPP